MHKNKKKRISFIINDGLKVKETFIYAILRLNDCRLIIREKNFEYLRCVLKERSRTNI